MQTVFTYFNLFAENKIEKRPPRYIITISILLAIFGISSLFEGISNLYLLDYNTAIILCIDAIINVFLAIGLLKRNKWARRVTIIVSILNLISTIIFLVQESIIDSILNFIAFGFILYYLFKSNVKEYFRDSDKNERLSSYSVPIFSTYKNQLVSITTPKGIKYLHNIFLLFSIFCFITFAILIIVFNIHVSEDSQINPDTRRTKNLDFNKTEEYYQYLFQYLIVLVFGLTWTVIYVSTRRNTPWSRTIVLTSCIIFVAFGMYSLLPYSNDNTGMFPAYITIQTVVAIVILFYFHKSKVEEYYQNIQYAK